MSHRPLLLILVGTSAAIIACLVVTVIDWEEAAFPNPRAIGWCAAAVVGLLVVVFVAGFFASALYNGCNPAD